MNIKKINGIIALALLGLIVIGCKGNKKTSEEMSNNYEKGTFGYDVNYLSDKDDLIILKSADEQAQVLLSGKYQAKVFTSTANGMSGNSHGFINYKFFESGVVDEHMNGFGGENRFWLGPEGGSYSIYFEPKATQVYDNWHTPKEIDIEPWEVKNADDRHATFTKDIQLLNYQGYDLKVFVERTVSLYDNNEIQKNLGITIPEGVEAVSYSTVNKITNKNDFEWNEKTGTVCIWMLDMLTPSDSAVTIIPYNTGSVEKLGTVVTSDYFGEIPAERLLDEDGMLYFKTDGNMRGKLGLNAKRSKAIAGNYDPISRRLTIVTFDVDPEAIYLNQEWNPEKNPLVGDALNAYNDGPLEDGSIMGPFLEVESSSPAAFLKPDESLTHTHNIYHFVGSTEALSSITEALFGVTTEAIKTKF